MSERAGAFADLFRGLGIDLSFLMKPSNSSLATSLINLSPKHKVLLVHNTYTSSAEVGALNEWKGAATLCLCPNANMYIEGRLPDIPLLASCNAPLVVGTDSLASNTQLSILDELKTISKHYPQFSLQELLEWATINGATYFGWDDILGTIKIRKKPGIVNISGLEEGFKLKSSSLAKRVA